MKIRPPHDHLLVKRSEELILREDDVLALIG
jgi:hypothetical protein